MTAPSKGSASVRPSFPEMRDVGVFSSGLARAAKRWCVGIGVFVIAAALMGLWWGTSRLWTLERLLVEEGAAVVRADGAWFLWRTTDDRGNPVVARTPGGPPLAGAWSVWGGVGGSELSGRQVATTHPTGRTGRWSGECVSERDVDGVRWTEFARPARARDVLDLGCDPALAGDWSGGFWGASGRFRFAPDGVIRDAAGQDIGRWAGRGRILLVHCRGTSGTYVSRFVRIEEGGGVRYETLGCEIYDLERGTETRPADPR